MDDAQLGRVPSDSLTLVLDPLQLTEEAVGGGVGVDPVGETGGPPDRRLGAATDQDRDALRRGGPDRHLPELVHLALMGERLGGPCLWEDRQDLLHCPAPLVDPGAETVELDLAPAKTQAESESPSTEQADGGCVLGETKRMVEGGEDHTGADLDGGGGGSDGATHDREGWHVAVVDEMVLGGPDRGEAKTFRFDGD